MAIHFKSKAFSYNGFRTITSLTSTVANSIQSVQPFSEIPKVSYYEIHKRLQKDYKIQMPKRHVAMKEYFDKLNTSLFLVKVPFVGNIVIFQDPNDAKTMFENDGKYPIEFGFNFFVNYRQHRKDLFPKETGVLGSHGEEWYQQRSLIQQDLMRPKSALYYVDDITKVTQDFLDLVENNLDSEREIGDVVPFIYRWALEGIGTIFLDTRMGCLDEPPNPVAATMVKCVDVVLGRPLMELTGQPPIWKYYETKMYKLFNEANERLLKVLEKQVRDSQAKNEDKVYSNKDEMSLLAKMTKKCGPDSNLPQVMAMDGLTAGIDTTGNTSAFMFYLLATNPDKQENLHREVTRLMGPEDKLTPDKLNKLKYPMAVLKETMRMLPVTSGFGRLTQKDMVMSGYQIPKGTRASYFTVNEMRSEKQFDQAHKFLPERWLRGCPVSKKPHPFAYVPFSHGARMCIGRRFAELEVQSLAIETVRRYKLEYEGPKIDIITPFVNRPDGPIKIKFVKRSSTKH